jgi:protein Mpv17
VPTMAASYKLWPAAHLVNFALVPPAYRVLYTNLVSVSTCSLTP